MHIPDGILSPAVLATGVAASAGILSASVKKSREELESKIIPKLGVMAAFIFAAQMVNFPILGVASGHLMGGALAAIMFGFWPATLVMTTVVALQAIIFGDGGITALGINILNMAIIAPGVAHLVYKSLKNTKLPQGICVFAAAFFSVTVVAFVCGIQLGLSGVVSFQEAIVTLVMWHVFIGIGEGFITMVVVPFAQKSKLGIKQVSTEEETKRSVGIWIVIAIVIGGFISLFASENLDGYEYSLESMGILDNATTIFNAPIADYTLQLGSGYPIIVGIFGVLLTLVVFFGIGKLISKK